MSETAKGAIVIIVSFFAGMLLAHQLDAPQINYWRQEANEYAYQNEILLRDITRALTKE